MGELLRFIGVTVMALITASTVRIVADLLVNGEALVREARERQDKGARKKP